MPANQRMKIGDTYMSNAFPYTVITIVDVLPVDTKHPTALKVLVRGDESSKIYVLRESFIKANYRLAIAGR